MNNQKIIRRSQYCQIVKEITGSDQYLVVGIDVAKENHYAFMGKVIPLAVVPPSQMQVVQVPATAAGSLRNKSVRLQRIIRRFSFVSNQI
jgi:hypothetical protein